MLLLGLPMERDTKTPKKPPLEPANTNFDSTDRPNPSPPITYKTHNHTAFSDSTKADVLPSQFNSSTQSRYTFEQTCIQPEDSIQHQPTQAGRINQSIASSSYRKPHNVLRPGHLTDRRLCPISCPSLLF